MRRGQKVTKLVWSAKKPDRLLAPAPTGYGGAGNGFWKMMNLCCAYIWFKYLEG